MLVEVERKLFDSLDDVSLVWTCIEPTIQKIRGKSFMVKFEASAGLTPGQRALLLVQMLYGHSGNGVVGLFSHLSYILSRKGVWNEIKKSVLYFGDNEMPGLLDRMEELYGKIEEKKTSDSDWLDISIDTYTGLKDTIDELDEQILKLMPGTIRLAGKYIRSHSEEFALIVD